MPSEVRDVQNFSSSSFFSENIPNERQIGFWKSDNILHSYAIEKSTASSSLEKRLPVEHQNGKSMEPQMQDKRVICNVNKLTVGAERPTKKVEASPYFVEGGKVNVMGSHYESSLFSSSLSDLFSHKLRMSSNSALYGHSVDTVASHFEEEEEIIESLEEMEAQTIGNLLPNDDDLLSGVADGLDRNFQSSIGDDVDELDLFSSVGGMDLEDDGSSGFKSGEFSDGSTVGEHPFGEHPSRTLFVRNINSNIEDSELKTLFEQYGDIRTLYTACKHRGFVMISYYDLRAAQRAMKALQNQPLRRRRLDIHYSIPKENPSEKDVNQGTLVVFNLDSSVSNDELRQIFGVYGEVKEIREAPLRSHHKFIEFYDSRAAEAALHALNRSDIAGKQIKLEPSRPGGARRAGLQLPTGLEEDESTLYSQQSSPPVSSTTAFSAQTSSVEPPFHHGISSSVPSGLSSLVRIESLSNQSSVAEPMKFNVHATSAFHPHSLPEYHEDLANRVHRNSAGNLFAGVNSRQSERTDSKQYSRVNSSLSELNESMFGSVGNGSSCAVPGHHYPWNNTYHSPPPGMMWPSSPSFINGVGAAHPQSRLIPRAPSHMMNPLLMNNHHVGSAPVVNPSLWDPDSSVFHPGSLGSLGISNSPRSMEFLSRNFFPLKTHHQSCMMFQGRSQMIPVMNSFDPSGERVRARRNDGNPNQSENRRQYELYLDRIMRGEDNRTTLMIKNIPNKYTSKMLLAAIDERHRGTYDFIYLPIDFKNKCNVGYAFINMTDPRMIIPFCQSFNGKKWEKFNSEKVASLAYGRIQGKSALIAHFQNSSLMNEDKRCRPILFNTDGPNAGDQVPFPMGVNVRTRPGKGRSTLPEEYYHGSPPNSAFGDDLSLREISGSAKESD